MPPAKKPIDFEATLNELEAIVQTLEQGDISLEQSLSAFEQGVKLTQLCQTALQQAEQKVQLLIKQQGEDTLVDWEDNASE